MTERKDDVIRALQLLSCLGASFMGPSVVKGTLLAGDGTETNTLAVGADGTFLAADSSQATGLNWFTIPSPPATYFNFTLTSTFVLSSFVNGFTIGPDSSAPGTPVIIGAAPPGAIFFQLPRAGTIRNLWASVRGSAGVGGSTPAMLFTPYLSSAPALGPSTAVPVFGATSIGVLLPLPTAGGAFSVSDQDFFVTTGVSAGQYLALLVSYTGFPGGAAVTYTITATLQFD